MPEGKIFLHSEDQGKIDITEADEPLMQSLRGREVAMIFRIK